MAEKKSKKKTTFELSAYAREKFGVELDPNHPRSELVKVIKRLEAQSPQMNKTPDIKPEKAKEKSEKKESKEPGTKPDK